ncbi:Uncharacterised protein [Streptococcus pneumoniae]|nr:Uncharacterised protein [Streptococcus pneumoniae]
MNNSIKLKRRLTQSPYLPLPDWSINCNYLSTVDYHYVSL